MSSEALEILNLSEVGFSQKSCKDANKCRFTSIYIYAIYQWEENIEMTF